jgi:hypothetical protein
LFNVNFGIVVVIELLDSCERLRFEGFQVTAALEMDEFIEIYSGLSLRRPSGIIGILT